MVVAIPKRKVRRTAPRSAALVEPAVEILSKQQVLVKELFACVEARQSFWAFRCRIHPKMKKGWFQYELACELQKFYEDMVAGKRPKLAIAAPPQHGKSETVVDFIAWLSGKLPNVPGIYASFSDRLGVRANLRIQRIMDSKRYRKVFPEVCLGDGMGTSIRNREMLEYLTVDDKGKTTPSGGSFRNTTVEGSITGEGLGLGVIDDPIKGRAEANSKVNRDKVALWLSDDFFTRFSDDAALLVIMTRWHLDDPVGRLKETLGDELRVLRYTAIAEVDEIHHDWLGRTIYRKKGEALFEELKSLQFLLGNKKVMTAASWASIYQGSPVVVGGDLFPVEMFGHVAGMPAGVKVLGTVRYWDKAGTHKGGAYTCGVRMHRLSDGRFLVDDVVRGQWKASERNRIIKQTTIDDGKGVNVWVEQEPGSGGLESAERTIADLAGYVVKKDKVQGDKETRAEPYAAQVQVGAVLLLSSDWNKPFKEEHEFFPNGPYKDQVDAAGGAFAKLTDTPKGRIGVLF